MSRNPNWLLDYKRNVYSQTGEDGIIEKILDTLPDNDHWCVEFGAWDGLHLTNTRHLIESKKYSAILIEADPNRFRDLQRNYAESEQVTTVNRLVGFNRDDNLDHILEATPAPDDFDLLSIDIDGNDYHVWQAMVRYRPKVIVIEFNPTIPTEVHFVQPADPHINQGASLAALVELGKEKDYELVSVLPFNAFFVRRDFFENFQLEDNSPETLRTDTSAITYLFSGFDGQIFLHGGCKLPWHNIRLKASKLQYLPKFLRSHPESYTTVQKIAFRLFRRGKKRRNE